MRWWNKTSLRHLGSQNGCLQPFMPLKWLKLKVSFAKSLVLQSLLIVPVNGCNLMVRMVVRVNGVYCTVKGHNIAWASLRCRSFCIEMVFLQ